MTTDSPSSFDHKEMEGPSGSLGSFWATGDSSPRKKQGMSSLNMAYHLGAVQLRNKSCCFAFTTLSGLC